MLPGSYDFNFTNHKRFVEIAPLFVRLRCHLLPKGIPKSTSFINYSGSSAEMEETAISSTAKRCAVITGANKGIGLEICRQLASNGVAVILTARDVKRGTEAIGSLKASGLSDVFFHQLDVQDRASIAALATYVETHFGKLDILVNNAGITGVVADQEAFREISSEGDVDWNSLYMHVKDENAAFVKKFIRQTYEMAEECLRTNYYGTKEVTEALLPLLQLSNSARIVNVSGGFGRLRDFHNEKVKAELQNVDGLTEEKIDEIVKWFLKDFKENKVEANGWPVTVSAYKVSKAAVNAYTRLMARKFPNFRVNCVHPGYVKTDMTSNTGLLSPEEGARAVVMLSLLPDDGPSGFYFDQKHPSTF